MSSSFSALGACLLLCGSIADTKSGQLLGIQGASSPGNINGVFSIATDDGSQSLILELFSSPSDGDIAVGPDGTIYIAFAPLDQLYKVDLESGATTLVGDFQSCDVSALAFSPDGTLFGFDACDHTLLTIDTDTGLSDIIGPVAFSGCSGMVFDPNGVLFAVGNELFDDASLWIVDPVSGASTHVGLLGNGPFGDPIDGACGLAFVGSQLFASASTYELDTDGLYEIDPLTGDAEFVGPFDKDGTAHMSGLAFFPGPGDTDRDGDVDFDDYETFVECYTGPQEPGGDPLPVGCVFLDSDDDNDIDCLDWVAFISNWTEETEPPTFEPCDGPLPCDGDANGDGVVDPLDTGYIMARFGCSVGAGDAECDGADVNADLVVDPLDAGYALARLGTCR